MGMLWQVDGDEKQGGGTEGLVAEMGVTSGGGELVA